MRTYLWIPIALAVFALQYAVHYFRLFRKSRQPIPKAIPTPLETSDSEPSPDAPAELWYHAPAQATQRDAHNFFGHAASALQTAGFAPVGGLAYPGRWEPTRHRYYLSPQLQAFASLMRYQIRDPKGTPESARIGFAFTLETHFTDGGRLTSTNLPWSPSPTATIAGETMWLGGEIADVGEGLRFHLFVLRSMARTPAPLPPRADAPTLATLQRHQRLRELRAAGFLTELPDQYQVTSRGAHAFTRAALWPFVKPARKRDLRQTMQWLIRFGQLN